MGKLIAEGYTGYLIQTTNDEKCGPAPTIGGTILSNEQDIDELHRFSVDFALLFDPGRLPSSSRYDERTRPPGTPLWRRRSS